MSTRKPQPTVADTVTALALLPLTLVVGVIKGVLLGVLAIITFGALS